MKEANLPAMWSRPDSLEPVRKGGNNYIKNGLPQKLEILNTEVHKLGDSTVNIWHYLVGIL